MKLSIPEHPFGASEPDPDQLLAVELAARHKLLVLTGGPGTGKTFTVSAIINMWRANGIHQIVGCALSGKAADRLRVSTGLETTTIHRLLGYNGETYSVDVVPAEALVIDEASMVDVELFSALLLSLPSACRVVVVGDVDQLPSIGPGDVLRDFIESGGIPYVRLTHIFRQAAESAIPHAARDVCEGRCPDFKAYAEANDLLFAPIEEPERIVEAVGLAFARAHRYDFLEDDVQVITPQRQTPIGTEALNLFLQRELNGEVETSAHVYAGRNHRIMEGDRVIHVKNNYALRVLNGQVGKISTLDPQGLEHLPQDCDHSARDASGALSEGVNPRSRCFIVQYGDRQVAYTKEEARELELAYAITVHKAQGSEFPMVVLPVHSAFSPYMLTRALVYTAMTRAERLLLMLGQARAIERAAQNPRGRYRRTGLQGRIKCHGNS